MYVRMYMYICIYIYVCILAPLQGKTTPKEGVQTFALHALHTFHPTVLWNIIMLAGHNHCQQNPTF